MEFRNTDNLHPAVLKESKNLLVVAINQNAQESQYFTLDSPKWREDNRVGVMNS